MTKNTLRAKYCKNPRTFTRTLGVVLMLTTVAMAASNKAADHPQVIKLERFRKALWKIHITIQGKPGAFLFDTGGGNTLLTADYLKGFNCQFWGRTTGYNMFGERADSPHCDGIQIKAGEVELTPVSVGKIDFGDRFAGDTPPDRWAAGARCLRRQGDHSRSNCRDADRRDAEQPRPANERHEGVAVAGIARVLG